MKHPVKRPAGQWYAPQPTPRWTDPRTQTELRCAGNSFFPPEARQLVIGSERYADIAGDGMGAVLGHVGWSYVGPAVCFVAALPGSSTVAGAAWAAEISQDDRAGRGLNMAYAVSEEFQGHGLAKLLACLALINRMDLLVGRFGANSLTVNVQCREGNSSARALAQSLGLVRDPARDFAVPKSPGVARYVGFTGHAGDCERVARRYVLCRDLIPTTTQPLERPEDLQLSGREMLPQDR